MPKVWDTICAKYPRQFIAPNSQGKTSLHKVWDCVQSALKRKKIKSEFECNPSFFRGALFGETVYFIRGDGEKLPREFWDKGTTAIDQMAYQLNVHPAIMHELQYLDLSAQDLVYDPACGNGSLIFQIRQAQINNTLPKFKIMASEKSQTMAQIAKDVNADVPIHIVDADELSHVVPNSVSLFILSGLVNDQVLTKEEGQSVLLQSVLRAKDYAYFIITGKTQPLFNSEELREMGFWPVLETKWQLFGFNAFYVCLSPRKEHVNGDQYNIIPIISELDEELGE